MKESKTIRVDRAQFLSLIEAGKQCAIVANLVYAGEITNADAFAVRTAAENWSAALSELSKGGSTVGSRAQRESAKPKKETFVEEIRRHLRRAGGCGLTGQALDALVGRRNVGSKLRKYPHLFVCDSSGSLNVWRLAAKKPEVNRG